MQRGGTWMTGTVAAGVTLAVFLGFAGAVVALAPRLGTCGAAVVLWVPTMLLRVCLRRATR